METVDTEDRKAAQLAAAKRMMARFARDIDEHDTSARELNEWAGNIRGGWEAALETTNYGPRRGWERTELKVEFQPFDDKVCPNHEGRYMVTWVITERFSSVFLYEETPNASRLFVTCMDTTHHHTRQLARRALGKSMSLRR